MDDIIIEKNKNKKRQQSLRDLVALSISFLRSFITLFPNIHLKTSPIPASLTSGCFSSGINLHARKAEK